MKILDITLLTIEEYYSYLPFIHSIEEEWWTQSCSTVIRGSVVVINGTSTKHAPITHYAHVRPVLIVSELKKKSGEKIGLFGYDWTVLDTDYFHKEITLEGDICPPHTTLLLCDCPIATHHFNKKNNAWRNSDLLKFLYNWIDNELRKATFVVNIVNDTEYMLMSSFAKKYNLVDFLDYAFDDAKGFLFQANDFCIEHIPHIGWKMGSINYYNKNGEKVYTFAELCEYFRKENIYDNP